MIFYFPYKKNTNGMQWEEPFRLYLWKFKTPTVITDFLLRAKNKDFYYLKIEEDNKIPKSLY